jgi:hypothetical protein
MRCSTLNAECAPIWVAIRTVWILVARVSWGRVSSFEAVNPGDSGVMGDNKHIARQLRDRIKNGKEVIYGPLGERI